MIQEREWIQTGDELNVIELKGPKHVVLLVPLGGAAREAVTRSMGLPIPERLYLVTLLSPQHARPSFVLGRLDGWHLEQIIQASFDFNSPEAARLARAIERIMRLEA